MKERNGKRISLKICLVSSVPATLWRFYSELIEQLRAQGSEVTIVSSDAPKLHKMGQRYGCTVLPLEITRRISFLKDIVAIYRLTKHLRHEKYQIVHAHTPKGGFIGTISAFLAGTTCRIYTVHGLVLETSVGWKRKLLWFAEWLTCKLATELLAVSTSLKKKVVEEKLCPAEKIGILGNGTACGINLEKFTRTDRTVALGRLTREKLSIPGNAIVIGFLGRIVPDKGIKALIEGFTELQERVSNVYLLLVGRFDNVRETVDPETVRTIDENDKIRYAGYVDDTVPFYAAIDIVVLPSRREGFGVSLIEGQALELPVVATRVTGCVDAVVDEVTGLLVDMDDHRQLAKAMLELIEKPELRKELGRAGCRRVRELFDSKQLIAEHMALYERVLGKKIGHEVM